MLTQLGSTPIGDASGVGGRGMCGDSCIRVVIGLHCRAIESSHVAARVPPCALLSGVRMYRRERCPSPDSAPKPSARYAAPRTLPIYRLCALTLPPCSSISRLASPSPPRPNSTCPVSPARAPPQAHAQCPVRCCALAFSPMQADARVLALNSVQQSARAAQRGDYEGGRLINFTHADLLRRQAEAAGATLPENRELYHRFVAASSVCFFPQSAIHGTACSALSLSRRSVKGGRATEVWRPRVTLAPAFLPSHP